MAHPAHKSHRQLWRTSAGPAAAATLAPTWQTLPIHVQLSLVLTRQPARPSTSPPAQAFCPAGWNSRCPQREWRKRTHGGTAETEPVPWWTEGSKPGTCPSQESQEPGSSLSCVAAQEVVTPPTHRRPPLSKIREAAAAGVFRVLGPTGSDTPAATITPVRTKSDDGGTPVAGGCDRRHIS